MNDKQTEDFQVFGDDWVYCKSHVRPHPTGWCSVDVSHKVGLGIPPGEFNERARAAYEKCRLFGLRIYGEKKENEHGA